ncbi:DNA-binding transcriptional LysR family regulator [Evansella vedderi]|uniref:DNA-binding transcriptional LysR family regulator n=1 Tax=Evansella vedderi TaxID=38282 RepID=A0ABT9ZVN3_9BACI|nr:LysR family transcriptional regulator [Evansella vedderi]MDQ0255303.1 DNA-binding transcriptional LysR family regulator [Evansella vedderi]
MDIRQLEYFAEVAKELSFTKAASNLHVSQPSLSKSIKNLENELGVPLFYRSSKKLELTDVGEAVLINTKHVLESFRNLTYELSDIMELKKGEIKIGIPPIIGAAFFPRLISSYKEAYPAINITLTEVGSKLIKEGIDDGSLDIGLVCNIPIQQDNFEVLELLKDPLMLVVHSENPLVTKQEVYLDDLVDQSFILYRKDFSLHDRIQEEFLKRNFHPTIVCESSQRDFMMEMVSAKLGVALLPSKIAQNINHPNIKALPITDCNIPLELGVIWKRNKYQPFAVREFISIAKHYLKDHEL